MQECSQQPNGVTLTLLFVPLAWDVGFEWTLSVPASFKINRKTNFINNLHFLFKCLEMSKTIRSYN